jgi:hypothetical protein
MSLKVDKYNWGRFLSEHFILPRSESSCQRYILIWIFIRSYQVDQRAKPGNRQTRQCSFGYWKTLDRKELSRSIFFIKGWTVLWFLRGHENLLKLFTCLSYFLKKKNYLHESWVFSLVSSKERVDFHKTWYEQDATVERISTKRAAINLSHRLEGWKNALSVTC